MTVFSILIGTLLKVRVPWEADSEMETRIQKVHECFGDQHLWKKGTEARLEGEEKLSCDTCTLKASVHPTGGLELTGPYGLISSWGRGPGSYTVVLISQWILSASGRKCDLG